MRRHNAGYCSACFVRHCREQVRRAIEHYTMIEPGERVLVAVSGGKDSLGLWQLLRELGYEADGLHLGLGIGEYSEASAEYARVFAAARGYPLREVTLATEYGFDVDGGARAAKRAPCSACGLSKRHVFNDVASEHGYPVLATGHNLDDEAAVLFGNVLRWDTELLGRQHPVLAAAPGFVRKVKPLIRLSEREMAAYCIVAGIDYIVEECPMAAGNRHLGYKSALNDIEERSPGTKAAFVFGFLERARPQFVGGAETARGGLRACSVCGSPTPADTCAFCRMRARAVGEPISVRSSP
ncbi:MAG TPA: ATP-binding protein [Acidimicrobiia bacterium]|nr:ATP-binding protein [Acidimicrobiia bacterium]